MMTKTSKKSSTKTMQQPFQCKYCNTKFHKESSLLRHQCVKKRRHMEANATGPRLGLAAFQKFHEMTSNSKSVKTLDDFINSQFYIDFVKFGHHIASLRPLYVDNFVEFVIKSGAKLKDWTSDAIYYAYIVDLLQREPPGSAVERSIEHRVEWTTQNNCQFSEFFSAISANEAASMIQTGKITPWVLYLASTGDALMSKFNEDHTRMIGLIIDPSVWARKFKRQPEDVDFIRTILDQAGL